MVPEAVAGRCAEERIDWDKMAFTPGARAYGRVGPDDDFTGAVNAMGMLIERIRESSSCREVKNPEQQARLGFLAEALCINCYPTDTTVRDAASPLFDFVWLASKKTFDAEARCMYLSQLRNQNLPAALWVSKGGWVPWSPTRPRILRQ